MKKVVIKIIKFIAIMIPFAIIGVLLSSYVTPRPIVLFSTPIFLSLAILLQITVHEAGHLVAGLISGYRFSSFRILNLALLNDNGRLVLKRQSIAGTAGQCIMQPPPLKDGRMPYTLYLSAGVIFNIIFSLLAVPLLFTGVDFIILAATLIIIAGLFFAVTNGIPMTVSGIGIPNDIKNLVDLNATPRLIGYLHVQLMVAHMSQTKRLKDMPEHLFALPAAEFNHTILSSSVAVFAFNRLVDLHDFNGAKLLGEKLLTEYTVVSLYKLLIYCDLMFIELIGENKEDVVRKLLLSQDPELKKAMAKFPSVIRSSYALELLHNKNPEAAEKCHSEFIKISKTYAIRTDIESETELIEIARQVGYARI